ncbi:MAG: ABC transporter permease [Microgenomates group bacterium]
MKKYLKIFQLSLLQYFVYRLNFILWRVRNILTLIFLYFFWTSVFVHRPLIFSYSSDKLVTYILLVNLLSSIVLGTRTADVASEIRSGDLANYLIKPFSFFKFIITKEAADKLINFLFSLFEIILLAIIFQPKIFIQENIFNYLMFFLTLIVAIVISFSISLTISFIAFWSAEIWAPRFIFFVLVTSLAGTFFPLDVLPLPIYNLLLLTPFPYLIYFPTKIYLHGFSGPQVVPLIISLIWFLILYQTMLAIWRKGIKNYSAYGR